MTIESEDVVDSIAKVICDYPKCWDEAPDDGWKEFWRNKARKVLAAAPIERLREENARLQQKLDRQTALARSRLKVINAVKDENETARAALNQQ